MSCGCCNADTLLHIRVPRGRDTVFTHASSHSIMTSVRGRGKLLGGVWEWPFARSAPLKVKEEGRTNRALVNMAFQRVDLGHRLYGKVVNKLREREGMIGNEQWRFLQQVQTLCNKWRTWNPGWLLVSENFFQWTEITNLNWFLDLPHTLNPHSYDKEFIILVLL